MLRDITQWKTRRGGTDRGASARPSRRSSQKTDFLAHVSHEIRTPLNAIIGFSELMIDERFGPIGNERYRDYLRDINRSGNHVLDLVNDLLDISKIEAGRAGDDLRQAVTLNEIAGRDGRDDAAAGRTASASSSAPRFARACRDVVADLRSRPADRAQPPVQRGAYTQAGGQVIVSTAYETRGDVVMRVRDTGIGMTQAEIEQALKPFKQINALKRRAATAPASACR